LRATVTARAGEPLVIEFILAERPEIRVRVQSDEPLSAAQNRALTVESLREQLGRLGNTPYLLAELQADLHGNPFAPSSLLNDLRRRAVELLSELHRQPRSITINDPNATLATLLAETIHEHDQTAAGEPQLHLLVRTPNQLEAAMGLRPASITLDYLDLYGLRPAVERVQAAGLLARVASPRVLKPGESRITDFLLKLNCPLVVRPAGLLYALQEHEHPSLIGDFSLNAANVLSAETFLRMGLARLTPTHDLNAAQISALAHDIGPERIEAVAYHHLPVFYTEHCVFCRFLSEGTSYKDCGQPCETHRVALRDVNGRAHPVTADVGCRNTVFGAEAQEASRYLDEWLGAGIRHFRLEFVHETAEQVMKVAGAFAKRLAGNTSSDELYERLRRIAPQGTTEGSLFVASNYRSLPLLQ
jgi:putative protease